MSHVLKLLWDGAVKTWDKKHKFRGTMSHQLQNKLDISNFNVLNVAKRSLGRTLRTHNICFG